MRCTSTRSGAGRALVAVYGVFALAATARSLVQLLTKASEAPLAYSLSALAGLVYVAATLGLAEVGPSPAGSPGPPSGSSSSACSRSAR